MGKWPRAKVLLSTDTVAIIANWCKFQNSLKCFWNIHYFHFFSHTTSICVFCKTICFLQYAAYICLFLKILNINMEKSRKMIQHLRNRQNAYVTVRGPYITKTRLYNFDPFKPHFYIVKLGCSGVYIIFLILLKKHRLWVLVRTASPRPF